MIRRFLVIPALLALALAASPAQAQLVGTDTAPGSSCAGFPAGAARMTADADQDGAQITLICDGTTWNADSGELPGCVENELVIRNGSAWDCVCLNPGPAGAVWTARDSDRNWKAIASSADGTKLVAVERLEQIYTSTDSGLSWTAQDSNRNWRGIASSADGTKLAATVDGGQIYTSGVACDPP